MGAEYFIAERALELFKAGPTPYAKKKKGPVIPSITPSWTVSVQYKSNLFTSLYIALYL